MSLFNSLALNIISVSEIKFHQHLQNMFDENHYINEIIENSSNFIDVSQNSWLKSEYEYLIT